MMGWRDRLHVGLGQALGLHHEDPVVQQIAGLKRMGDLVYGVNEEISQRATALAHTAPADQVQKTLQRAQTYYSAAEVLVTFSDAFVLDAFLDPDHPKHIPHVTFVQAAQFYRQIPDLITAVRRELAYPGSGAVPLPILPGPRIEAEGHCPTEHLLAMQRAANQTEDLLGTRIELLERQEGNAEQLRTPILLMTDARSKKESADAVIGAIRRGDHIPPEEHEQAEAFYYDGVLRSYLYAAQELALPGITQNAPSTEDEPDEEPTPPNVVQFPNANRPPQRSSSNYESGWGFGGGGGLNWGTLMTADIVANLVTDLLGGMFGGGGFGNW